MEPFALTSTFDVEAAGCGSSSRLATHSCSQTRRVASYHSAAASNEGGLARNGETIRTLAVMTISFYLFIWFFFVSLTCSNKAG